MMIKAAAARPHIYPGQITTPPTSKSGFKTDWLAPPRVTIQCYVLSEDSGVAIKPTLVFTIVPTCLTVIILNRGTQVYT